MEVPPLPIDSDWYKEFRGDFVETMDTSIVTELVLEAAERADLVQQDVIESTYGRGWWRSIMHAELLDSVVFDW